MERREKPINTKGVSSRQLIITTHADACSSEQERERGKHNKINLSFEVIVVNMIKFSIFHCVLALFFVARNQRTGMRDVELVVRMLYER